MKKAAQAKTKPSVNEQVTLTIHDKRLFLFILIQYVANVFTLRNWIVSLFSQIHFSV